MFVPPFCPYKACAYHTKPPKDTWWKPAGYHDTKCFGLVPRFSCNKCCRSFSTQTFHINYYAKRKINYQHLESLGASSVSVRALGRNLGCSPDSVQNRLDRLARQSIACHAKLRPQARRHENVCIDGFVSFDRSQYFPNNITLSITSASRYVLSFTHATLRRSGTMREDQKERRDRLYPEVEFEPKALERSFSELLDELERDRPPAPMKPLVIITDEKLDYQRALRAHRLFACQDAEHRVVHHRVNSRIPRTFSNPLFPANYIDREIRKDQAAHHRESSCFARAVSNGLSRMACYLGWHNYKKRYLIKAPVRRKESHGEMAGIGRASIRRERRAMFHDRAFLSLQKLDGIEDKLWRKAFPTPGRSGPSYLPKFAFA